MSDKTKQTELYVSCRPQRPPSPFCVLPGKCCVLQACGLGPDQTVPILKAYGEDQCEPARDLAGNLLVLTAETPAVLVSLSGNYKLDVSGLAPDPCVYITEECYNLEDLPGGGTLVPFDPPEKPLIVGGIFDRLTCLPAWVSYPCDGAGNYDYTSPTVYTMDPDTGQATETSMIEVQSSGGGAPATTPEYLDVPITITGAEAGTAADLIAAAIAEGLTFPTYGAPTADDVQAITGSGDEVMYGGQTGDSVKDTNGVTATTEFDVPANCEFNFVVCFCKRLTDKEIAAL